jgi:hypothetical protein
MYDDERFEKLSKHIYDQCENTFLEEENDRRKQALDGVLCYDVCYTVGL